MHDKFGYPCDDDREPLMNRPAVWERLRPAADAIVDEARAAFGGPLPAYAEMLLWLQAMERLERTGRASLPAMVARFGERRLRPSELERLRGEFVTEAEWSPNADGHDGDRMLLVARMLESALAHRDREFELYRPAALLAAVEDTLTGDEGDALKSMLSTAGKLARSGFRRRLAAMPGEDQFQQLAEEMPNFAPVVEFYAGQAALAWFLGLRAARSPPVLLLGDPGIGKTRFARRLAELLNSVFRVIPMAAQSASWILTGLDRSWSTAKPGLVYITLAGSPVANPVLLIDEIDKAASDARYDPLGGLYALLEWDSAREFVDEYVGVPIDASAIIWIATANDASTIPKPILSRLMPFHVGPPTGSQSRGITGNVYRRIIGGAPFSPLSEAVGDHLIGFVPREIKAELLAGAGRAAQRARRQGDSEVVLRLEDFPVRLARRKRVGFV